jgi:hypothetical protein
VIGRGTRRGCRRQTHRRPVAQSQKTASNIDILTVASIILDIFLVNTTKKCITTHRLDTATREAPMSEGAPLWVSQAITKYSAR